MPTIRFVLRYVKVFIMREKDLQSLLLEHPELIEEGLTQGRAEFQTSSGPVDLLFKDKAGKHLIIELKLNGGSANEMQANRYAGAFCFDNNFPLQSVRKMLLALKIEEKTRKICEAGGIEIKELKQIPLKYCLDALELKEPKVIEKEIVKTLTHFVADIRIRFHDCYFEFAMPVDFRKIKELDRQLWKAGIFEPADVQGPHAVYQCRYSHDGGTSLNALSLIFLHLDIAASPIKTFSIQIYNQNCRGHRGIYLDLSTYETSYERAFYVFQFISKAIAIPCENETIFTNTEKRFPEPTRKLNVYLPMFWPQKITSPTAGKTVEEEVTHL